MIGTIDLDSVRARTPGCEHVTHLNNAGAALPPHVVVDTVVGHLQREASIGAYEAEAQARPALDQVYHSLAGLLGCEPSEISLFGSATRAWVTAFSGIPFRRGDRILTGRAEYASNALMMLRLAETTGVVIDVVDDDETGQIDVAELERKLDGDVRLIALTHVPTGSGLINPAEDVGRLARDAGAWYLLDACQSVGQLPLDVDRIGCDILSAAGRKFLRGPRGTGFLYVRSGRRDELRPPVIDMHAATWTSPTTYELQPDGRRYEEWESSPALRLGLGAAVDDAQAIGIEAISARALALAERLRQRLSAIERVTVHDKGARRAAIVTFSIRGIPAAEVSARLRTEHRINTSVTAVTSAQFDLPARGLSDLVRASPHYYNTDAEVDALADAVERLT